jgi:hypothetical protein
MINKKKEGMANNGKACYMIKYSYILSIFNQALMWGLEPTSYSEYSMPAKTYT